LIDSISKPGTAKKMEKSQVLSMIEVVDFFPNSIVEKTIINKTMGPSVPFPLIREKTNTQKIAL
jgi:hypothetical protein